MWLLLYISLVINPVTVMEREQPNGTILERYTTEEECHRWRDYIGFHMAEAYPFDRTFVIVCRKR